MKITAYECDTCHTISKVPPKFNIEGYSEFRVKTYRSYSDDKTACSNDCLRAALVAWLAEQDKPEDFIESDRDREPKAIRLEGVGVS
jgi:hypothetical protein